MSSITIEQCEEQLRTYWGYQKFRPSQRKVIEAVISWQDTLAVMPTGAGKSICYQIPSLLLDGLTLVVSPLIALMEDQVHNLESRNIAAKTIHAGIPLDEQSLILEAAKSNNLKLLYLSPERLLARSFLEILPQLPLKFLAVDEAHCISQWGHDFRPAYRSIAQVKEVFPEVPFLAVTATATDKVRTDIVVNLDMQNHREEVFSSKRNNLSYYIEKTEDKNGFIQKYLKSSPGKTGIIYARNRKLVMRLSKYLRQRKCNVRPYHAGLSNQVKSKNQKEWIDEKVQAIIATNAFGMGIDKSKVDYVLHYDLPPNLEEYTQEAGRAGRNGDEAEVIILLNQNDIQSKRKDIENSFPPLSFVREVYKYLCSSFSLGIGEKMQESRPISIKLFAEKYKVPILACYHAFHLLEKMNYIFFADSLSSPSLVKLSKAQVETLDDITGLEKEKVLVNKILRIYDGIFFKKVKISESYLKTVTGYSISNIVSMLNGLHQEGFILYEEGIDQPRVKIRGARLKKESINLSAEVYEDRKSMTILRLNAMEEYLSTSNCRQQVIDSYFGFDSGELCGKCDNCRAKSGEGKSSNQVTVNKIIELLKAGEVNMEELLPKFSKVDRIELIRVLEKMENEGLISIISNTIVYNS